MADLERNKEIARRYLDLIARGDSDAVADMFTDDGAIIVQSRTMLPPEVRGKEAIRTLIASLPSIFPETGLRIVVDTLTAEDDRVSIQAHSDATHVSGKPYNNRYHFLLFLEDGKIRESHEYLDSLLLTDVFFDGARAGNKGKRETGRWANKRAENSQLPFRKSTCGMAQRLKLSPPPAKAVRGLSPGPEARAPLAPGITAA